MLWNSSYAIGHETVDNEHKEIFGMVDTLLVDDFRNRPEKIKTTVDFLVGYVGRHFANEESLMRESNYPKTDEHKAQHKKFVETVGVLVKKIEQNIDSIDIVLEVNNVIVNWLAEHVMGSDKMLVNHYKMWKESKK